MTDTDSPNDADTLLEEYLERMKGSSQFRYFGLTPAWKPGTGDAYGFCWDEVVRQMHDPRDYYDGGVRVDGMFAAWNYMSEVNRLALPPTVDHMLAIGHCVEPRVNAQGFRLYGVQIGSGLGAPAAYLPGLCQSLIDRTPYLELEPSHVKGPDYSDYRKLWSLTDGDIYEDFAELLAHAWTVTEWYAAYEAVHPFGDGNGRSGKVWYNYLNGTLDEPELVIDLFGGGNP